MPGIDNSKTGEEATAEMERWTKAYEAGPTAFMAFHPEGATPMSPTQLGIQAVLDILIGITAAFIVSFFRNTSFLCKVSSRPSMPDRFEVSMAVNAPERQIEIPQCGGFDVFVVCCSDKLVC